MTLAAVRHPAIFALPAGAGALTAFVLGTYPPSVALAALSIPITACALVIWPWAALPVATVVGTVATQALGLERVTPVIAVHGILVAVGFVAVAVRAAFDPTWERRVKTRADVPMLAFAGAILLGAAYGAAAGNSHHDVLVGAYQLGVVPAYFFLATHSLRSPSQLRAGCIAFAVAASAVVLVGLAEPGRHGGLFSALALPPLLVAAAAKTSGLRRALVLAAAALFALDVVLSAYRAVWLATLVAVTLVFASRIPRLRRTAAAAFVVALVVAVLGIGLQGDLRARAEGVGVAVHEPSGYRAAEARVGWEAFIANPLLGGGVGHVESDTYVPGFGVTDVGPEYHAFYVTLIVNLGLVGFVLFIWPVVAALRGAGRGRAGHALAFPALLVGFAAAAAFAAPTDGHWELGLLAALTLLAARFESSGGGR